MRRPPSGACCAASHVRFRGSALRVAAAIEGLAEELLATGKADMIALARGLLYDPRWGWHAAAHLGASVNAPPQYWRSQPSSLKYLFNDVVAGVR